MEEKVNIDVIILSYAKDEDLKALTIQTIDTLVKSEDPKQIAFNIIVIESNKNLKPFQFQHTTTMYTDVEFGYNRYMNIGIKATSNPYVCLCNNDLIFHKHWATNILQQMAVDNELRSANPYCDITHTGTIPDDGKNIISTQNGILIGWCIFFKREVLDVTGDLDEKFKFWYADNDYGSTMAKHKIKHALVTSSKVTHVGSKTHSLLTDEQLFDYTYGQYLYFDLKWNNAGRLAYYLKYAALPLFKYAYLKRTKGNNYMLMCRLIAKLYGGLK